MDSSSCLTCGSGGKSAEDTTNEEWEEDWRAFEALLPIPTDSPGI
jgi:hypothetical protein